MATTADHHSPKFFIILIQTLGRIKPGPINSATTGMIRVSEGYLYSPGKIIVLGLSEDDGKNLATKEKPLTKNLVSG